MIHLIARYVSALKTNLHTGSIPNYTIYNKLPSTLLQLH